MGSVTCAQHWFFYRVHFEDCDRPRRGGKTVVSNLSTPGLRRGRRGAGRGLASLCVGVGQGVSTLVEAIDG